MPVMTHSRQNQVFNGDFEVFGNWLKEFQVLDRVSRVNNLVHRIQLGSLNITGPMTGMLTTKTCVHCLPQCVKKAIRVSCS